VDRNTFLWTLVLFFGASILFGSLRRATEGESTALVVGVQVGALALLVAALVVFVRRRR
jgi:MYXO-CTERM domain-containing protein